MIRDPRRSIVRTFFLLLPRTLETQLRRQIIFPYLSTYRRARRCLRGAPAIIHGPRFITHNSGSRALASFPGVISVRTDAGLKSRSGDERDLSIEFHETNPPGSEVRSLLPPRSLSPSLLDPSSLPHHPSHPFFQFFNVTAGR